MEDFAKEQAKALGAASKDAIADIVKPSAVGLGKIIESVLYRKFGDYVYQTDLMKTRHELAKEAFKKAITEKINEIPESKLTFPKTQVLLGTAFDSEFIVEEPELRELFANLLAASVNKDSAANIHPSFSNILRQLSPNDAQLLMAFKNDKHQPIIKLGYKKKNGGAIYLYENLYEPKLSNAKAQAVSLECLRMHGLLTIDYDKWFTQDTKYLKFQRLKEILFANPIYSPNNPQNSDIAEIDLVKGLSCLTSFGSQLLSVCT